MLIPDFSHTGFFSLVIAAMAGTAVQNVAAIYERTALEVIPVATGTALLTIDLPTESGRLATVKVSAVVGFSASRGFDAAGYDLTPRDPQSCGNEKRGDVYRLPNTKAS